MKFARMPGVKFELIATNKQIGTFAPYIGSEDKFQESVARYLDIKGYLWCHCPNGGSRNKIEGAKLKRHGVKPGVPDILIFEARNGYAGIAIELKCGKNKPSADQIFWAESLRKRGWYVFTTWSLDELIATVENYFR